MRSAARLALRGNRHGANCQVPAGRSGQRRAAQGIDLRSSVGAERPAQLAPDASLLLGAAGAFWCGCRWRSPSGCCGPCCRSSRCRRAGTRGCRRRGHGRRCHCRRRLWWGRLGHPRRGCNRGRSCRSSWQRSRAPGSGASGGGLGRGARRESVRGAVCGGCSRGHDDALVAAALHHSRSV